MTFVRPGSIEAAVEELHTPGALLLAGGTATALLLKAGLLEPDKLIWLGGIEQLSKLTLQEDGSLFIGSCVTLSRLAEDDRVRKGFGPLAAAAGQVGNPRVRSMATLGGHLAHADPRQDLPPVLLALDASVEVVGPNGRREIAMPDLAVGFMETSIGEDEVIEGIRVPGRAGASGTYARYAPVTSNDYPTVSVAVELRQSDGVVLDARIAIGGGGSRALLMTTASDVLKGRRVGAEEIAAAGELVRKAVSPVDDHRGSAEYKAAMAALWTRRALLGALGPSRLSWMFAPVVTCTGVTTSR